MLNDDLLQAFMTGFYGYGTWKAKLRESFMRDDFLAVRRRSQ